MPQAMRRDVRPARSFNRILQDGLVAGAALLFGVAVGGISVCPLVVPSDRAARPDIRAAAAPQSLMAAIGRLSVPAAEGAAQTASRSVPDTKTALTTRQPALPNVMPESTIADLPAERMRSLFDFFDGSQQLKHGARLSPSSAMSQHRSTAAIARIRSAHRRAIAGIAPPRT